MTPKRSLNGVPWFSISGTFHPAPKPTSTRPPDTRSRLATAFAVVIGSRCGSSMIPKPSRSVVVVAAAAVRVTNGSSER